MVKITFPDGKSKKYETGITGIEVAKDISVSLAKEAVAILINGNQKDLSDPIIEDSPISIHLFICCLNSNITEVVAALSA